MKVGEGGGEAQKGGFIRTIKKNFRYIWDARTKRKREEATRKMKMRGTLHGWLKTARATN